MSANVWLRLGRVSNLPTVWTNVLAALALGGVLAPKPSVAALGGSLSLFYVGGMYLNDAFDCHIDAVERPGRPIPSGQVSASAVFALGFAMLAGGLLGGILVAAASGLSVLGAALSGAALAALIVCYDAYHKQNPLSPVLMGACRVMVYVTAVYAAKGELDASVLWGALALWCYLIGLTYAAKQEAMNRLTRLWPLAFLAAPLAYGVCLALRQPVGWPFLIALAAWVVYSLSYLRPGPRRAVPQAVVRLIAGISLLDALFVAVTAGWQWAVLAAALCGATRLAQRYVPGT